MHRPKGLFLLDRLPYDAVYAPLAAGQIARRVDLTGPPQTQLTIKNNPRFLEEAELIFSGWGCPKMDRDFLDAAPNLKAIFYGAGAISGWATSALWDRNIAVTTANDANAIPVAEYTLSTILFSLKHGWRFIRDPQQQQGFRVRNDLPGNYHSAVGLVGTGTIARMVAKLLAPFHTTILAYDPFLTSAGALAMGVRKCTLSEIFTEADVVSLHLPDLPTTRGMINGKLIASMKTGATLINSARGGIIHENEMIDVLRDRSDLQAVLDVTEHEPLSMDSPLRRLPNVVLTPHIAGSQGRECQRMGDYMVEELDRYLAGEPLRWQVRPKHLDHTVHYLAPKVPSMASVVR